MKILSSLLTVAFVATLAFGFSSCKGKCVECSVIGTPAETICEEDFDSKSDYDDAVAVLKLFGTCK